MRNRQTTSLLRTLRSLTLVLAATALSSQIARAVPYASGVTRNGNTVTFVLNQDAQGLVVLRNGANPVYPGITAGTLSFDMTGYTSYQIIVTGNTAKAWSQYIPDGTDRNFEYAFGVAINKNPASTNFGRVYVSQSRDGTTGAGRFTKSGVYMVRADGVALGFVTGGVDWTAAGNSSPFKSTIGPDNHLYVSDFSNDRAYEFNDDMSVATRVIDDSNKTDVGLTSSQYVESLWVEGTQAGGDRVIYAVDSNFNDNARKGLIRYDLGANAAATPGDTGSQVIGPNYYSFYPRDVARDSSGNWYLNQYRATAGQAPAISKFDGSLPPPINTAVWETANTYTYTYGLGLNEAGGTLAVGSANDGTVWFFDMATGAFVESFDAGGAIRDQAFDAAGNMITVDNSTEYARFWSPGGYTISTTRSDGTFSLTRLSLVNVSVTATTDTTSMDLSQPPGVFTLTRTGDTGVALPVGYTLSGTATNGVQYQLLSGTATFPAGSGSATVQLTAKPYSPAGPTRSVILSINGSNSYSPAAPLSASVWIVDTNKPAIHIAVRDTQFYERTNDLARFTLTRWGDTNVYLSQVNVTYAGTAIESTHFYGDASATMSYGDQTKDVLVHAIQDGILTGPLTVTATVAAAGDGAYVLGTPATSAAVTRVDAEDPPETVLWSDNLHADTSASWTQFFATTNGAPYDAIVTWAYDYSQLLIPPAPHSGVDTHGLSLTVNKNDAQLAAAALNLYPNGRSFSGNYAFRFDMFLIQNDTAGTTEYALFGINHSGTKTNWFRNSTAGYAGVDLIGWNFDGIFYDVESDGSALGDYVGYSSPTTANHNPTPITPGRSASTLAGIFKTPPWTPGAGTGGAAANVSGTTTPIWADVEIAQINGVIYWSINHTLIFAYTNTTGYASGNVMLGYEDGYDSIGYAGGSVIYANARVISLEGPRITQIVLNSGNAEITFVANASDVPGQFVLQSANAVTGAYTDTNSTITSLGGGAFKAVKTAGTGPTFYRIRRTY